MIQTRYKCWSSSTPSSQTFFDLVYDFLNHVGIVEIERQGILNGEPLLQYSRCLGLDISFLARTDSNRFK